MGRKSIVPYALYRAHGFYNPLLARGLSVDKPDLEALWESLEFMFEHDRSAARPEMNTRGLYVFTHECDKGNAPAHKLFERVTVKPKDALPQSFDDYRSAIAVPGEGPVEGFKGVSLTRVVHDSD
jgi:CRISPR-associated protein Csd2